MGVRDSLKLEDIDRNPGSAAASVRLRSGEEAVLRPLEASDAEALGDLFVSLSEATLALYAPHPFDRATAQELCRNIRNAETTRMIAAVGEGGAERIIAYFILVWSVMPGELRRYAELGIDLASREGCTLAPCVADAYQDQGVGSAVMAHVIPLARRLGFKSMILFGGTREENVRAIHFYEKHGFRKVGEFIEESVNNYDMIMDLQAPQCQEEEP